MTKLRSFLDQNSSVPLTPELTGLYLKLMMNEAWGLNRSFTREVANEFGPVGLILHSRLPETVKITEGLAAFVCRLSECNPGRLVMWAVTLSELCKRQNKMIDTNVFVDAFPLGFPSEKDYSTLWDEQKGSTGANRLDDPAEWV
jgi:hypothetical protein